MGACHVAKAGRRCLQGHNGPVLVGVGHGTERKRFDCTSSGDAGGEHHSKDEDRHGRRMSQRTTRHFCHGSGGKNQGMRRRESAGKLASLPTALSNFFPKDASGSTQATKGAEPSRARRNLTQLGRAEGSELAGHEPRTRRKLSDELFFLGGRALGPIPGQNLVRIFSRFFFCCCCDRCWKIHEVRKTRSWSQPGVCDNADCFVATNPHGFGVGHDDEGELLLLNC